MATYKGAYEAGPPGPVLTDRQGLVLNAVVSSWIGSGGPVASETVAAILPVQLSPQSVRNTLAELARMRLLEKPHRSAGRIPTERGIRVFVDHLMTPSELGPFECRDLEDRLEGSRATGLAQAATGYLSERTRQLGFFRVPRLDRLTLRHVSFVRVSSERVMAILLSDDGRAFQRVIDEPGTGDQARLDRLASDLCERIAGRTLRELRAQLLAEAAALRNQAESMLARALGSVSGEALEGEADISEADLVFGTQLALLEQPEFHDPERLRALLRTVEEKQRLVLLLDAIADGAGVRVAFGTEVGASTFQDCAVVVAPYGDPGAPLGALGVIGSNRMDYARVIPLVGTMSRMLTGILDA